MTSPAALAFLDDLLAGPTAEAGPADGRCRRIAMTQAELSRRCGRSAGTVAYYLASAGPDVVTRRRGGVVVNLDGLDTARARLGAPRRRRDDVAEVLAASWGRPVGGSQDEVELLTDDGRTPSLADVGARLGLARSSAQRHLSDLSARGALRRHGGRLFLSSATTAPPQRPQAGPTRPTAATAATSVNGTDMVPVAALSPVLVAELVRSLLAASERLAGLAEVLLAQDGNPRTDARSPRTCGAQFAESREGTDAAAGAVSLKSTKKDRNLSFSSANREPLRAEARGSRLDRDHTHPLKDNDDLTDDEVDAVLSSLAAAARQHGVNDMLDARGHDYLRQIPSEGLARAAAHVEQLLRGGYPIPKPMGILVKAAMNGDKTMFTVPPEAPPAGPSSRLVDAARSHAATLASCTDIDDDERRYTLTQRYRDDQPALEAALAVLDRSRAPANDIQPAARS